MWLRPNRSLSRRGLRGWCIALAGMTVVVATLGARAGNVYAPVFGLVEAAGVVYALSRAWQAGNRSERITIDARALEVECLPGHHRIRFQSGWVRVGLEPAGWRQRLVLTSHGGGVEVGAFLGDGERLDAMRTLRKLLAEQTGPRRDN